MFDEVDNFFDNPASDMILGKMKGGGSGERSGCGCAIVMMLVIFAIVIYYFLENS
jgi:hypothetical protein